MSHETRREFLQNLGRIAGATVLAGALQPLAAYAADKPKKEEWLSIGKLDDLPMGKAFPIKTATNVSRKKAVKEPMLVAFRDDKGVKVMSSKCTHRGCEVKLKDDGTYLCPCHSAEFDKQGKATKGPAKKDMPWYAVKVENGEVMVDIATPLPAPADAAPASAPAKAEDKPAEPKP